MYMLSHLSGSEWKTSLNLFEYYEFLKWLTREDLFLCSMHVIICWIFGLIVKSSVKHRLQLSKRS